MIPDRDYFLAQREVDRRRREAADVRAVREARLIALEARRTQPRPAEQRRGFFGWLRRLAGARS